MRRHRLRRPLRLRLSADPGRTLQRSGAKPSAARSGKSDLGVLRSKRGLWVRGPRRETQWQLKRDQQKVEKPIMLQMEKPVCKRFLWHVSVTPKSCRNLSRLHIKTELKTVISQKDGFLGSTVVCRGGKLKNWSSPASLQRLNQKAYTNLSPTFRIASCHHRFWDSHLPKDMTGAIRCDFNRDVQEKTATPRIAPCDPCRLRS